MITFNKQPGQRILELGGGSNRHPATDVHTDIRKVDGVDFETDLNSPNWPISSAEFDCVFSQFCAEHISWRNIPQFLQECFRVTKPGGTLVLVVPNTEAQMRFILAKPEWDGDEGSMLFGDQNYAHNHHCSAWSPRWALKVLAEAGWENIIISPISFNPATPPGDETDMRLDARKPVAVAPTAPPVAPGSEATLHCGADPSLNVRFIHTPTLQPLPAPRLAAPKKEWPAPGLVFDRHYFDGGKLNGGYAGEGYRDFPAHEITARKVLERKPESVLELGAGRGYVLKRIQDTGIRCQAVDVSYHCCLTRVMDPFAMLDVMETPWPFKDGEFDLCFSAAFLEHVQEEALPAVLAEMKRVCKRGLHGVFYSDIPSNPDGTKRTLRPAAWWRDLFDQQGLTRENGWEVLDKDELEAASLPPDYLKGDGRLKVNLGSFTTCFHHGWLNCDVADLIGWAQSYGYQFARLDMRQGLPFSTGVVDAIFAHHVLEHFTTKECLEILRECRRVIRPDGAMRIAVPDAKVLTQMYQQGRLGELDDMNGGCAEATTQAGKLWAMLGAGHQAALDEETLCQLLKESGWIPLPTDFRLAGFLPHQPARPAQLQILRECTEMHYGGTALVCDAIPQLG